MPGNRSRRRRAPWRYEVTLEDIFIKLNLSAIGILVCVSPCYPKNAPDPSPTEEALAIQRLLQDALRSVDEVILYSLDPEEIPHVLPGATPYPPGNWAGYSTDGASLVGRKSTTQANADD